LRRTPAATSTGGYELKLNSYDLGVDIELPTRPAHPLRAPRGALRGVTGQARPRVLRRREHRDAAHVDPRFKVNFCKFTNETRLYLEDASARTPACVPRRAQRHRLRRRLRTGDRLRQDPAGGRPQQRGEFPEVPLLGVLPGTGGLTRIADKRKVRRDRTDVFSTIAEGIKGKRAVEWNLVDAIAPLSRWNESVGEMARSLADSLPRKAERGIQLEALAMDFESDAWNGNYVSCKLDRSQHTAELTLEAPERFATSEMEAVGQGAAWWILRALRELDECLLQLRLQRARDRSGAPSRARPGRGLARHGRAARGLQALVRQRGAALREARAQARGQHRQELLRHRRRGLLLRGPGPGARPGRDRIYVLNDPDAPVSLGTTEANAACSRWRTGSRASPRVSWGIPPSAVLDLPHRDHRRRGRQRRWVSRPWRPTRSTGTTSCASRSRSAPRSPPTP
jgi:benzoyl-CoA-dihydrodiol lyase